MNNDIIRTFSVAILATLIAFSLSACGKKTVEPVSEAADSVEVAAAADAAPAETGQATEAMGTEEPLESEPAEDTMMAATLEGRTSNGLFPVYFDFDKSTIRDDQVERMEKNAAFLKANGGVNIRIEGNCDERGTNEYNMALGERRAMSAKKYLVNLGIAANRLDTISYGEEKPINFGHDELSWSQNRRGDFVITK